MKNWSTRLVSRANSGLRSSHIVLGDETKQNLMEMVDKHKHKQVFRQVVDTHHYTGG